MTGHATDSVGLSFVVVVRKEKSKCTTEQDKNETRMKQGGSNKV